MLIEIQSKQKSFKFEGSDAQLNKIIAMLGEIDVSLKSTSQIETQKIKLSKREEEILELISKGLADKQIADQLDLTTSTIRYHINRILRKLRAQNRTEAVVKYKSMHA